MDFIFAQFLDFKQLICSLLKYTMLQLPTNDFNYQPRANI